jgi:hypothetical protein
MPNLTCAPGFWRQVMAIVEQNSNTQIYNGVAEACTILETIHVPSASWWFMRYWYPKPQMQKIDIFVNNHTVAYINYTIENGGIVAHEVIPITRS